MIVLLISIYTTSCGTKENSQYNTPLPTDKNRSKDTQVFEEDRLTHVFTESTLPLPENLIPTEDVRAFVEKDKITLYCTALADKDGKQIREHYLCETDFNDTESVMVKLKIDESVFVEVGIVTDDKVYLIYREYDEIFRTDTQVLLVYNRREESSIKVEGLEKMFPETGEFYHNVSKVEVDSDGYIYLAANNSLCVLTPDLTKSFDYIATGSIRNLTTDKDGRVCAIQSDGANIMDRETRSPSEKILLPDGTNTDWVCFHGEDYYYINNIGLYRMNRNIQSGELVINWQNSNFSYTVLRDIHILSSGQIYISYSKTENNRIQSYNSLFTSVDDIDLSAVTEITVAYINDILSPLPMQMVNYNQANTNVRVTGKDYSVYNEMAETRLMMDMVSSSEVPDILCLAGGSTEADRWIADILRNDFYLNLYTLIEMDPDIRKEDIVGAVKNTYEIDGQLAAVTPSFKLQTLLASESAVGERTSWTLGEMLDYVETLSGDTVLIRNKSTIFNNSLYTSFVDMKNYTCDFENQTFMDMLAYITEPQEEILIGTNKYEPYQTGRIVLAQREYGIGFIDNYSSDAVFFENKNSVRIGYPSETGTGHRISSTYVYIIPKNAEHSEEAWKFIRSLILDKPEFTMLSTIGIRMLRSQNELYKEDLENINYFYPYTGGVKSWSGYREEKQPDEYGRIDGQAGVLVKYDEMEFDAFMEFIDSAGVPVYQSVSSEVLEIINEEISAYESGVRSAEDTARIIQSRVSLWLAERK